MKIVFVVAIWLAAAIVVGTSGAMQKLPPPAPQIIIAGLTVALLITWRTSEAFKSWVQTIDIRVLIALHLTRFVGAYFVYLSGSGELPYSFAIPAGCGDMAVAAAGGLLLLCWRRLRKKSLWVGVWNVAGLLDILGVVVSAAGHALADRASMAGLLHLPLSLLPTFLVPLIIASHIFIFSRLRNSSARFDGAEVRMRNIERRK
jgi:hypothetical protein